MNRSRLEGSRAGLRLRVYTLLSRALFPKSYLGKIMLVACIGINIPLLALVLYLFLIARIDLAQALPSLAVALVATVVGGAVTLFVLYALLAPVSAASRTLRAYLERGGLPRLPTGSEDEAGKLDFDDQHAIIHLDEIIRSLEELSAKDTLTGAYNRRTCEERLAENVARVERSGETLTLAALDADRLKEINDRHGHATGDACLRHLASTIERNIRKSDWFARWGGDEFVVALWDAKDPSGAEAVVYRIAEELRRNSARLPRGVEERLSVSAGIAWYRGGKARGNYLRGRMQPSLGPNGRVGARSPAPHKVTIGDGLWPWSSQRTIASGRPSTTNLVEGPFHSLQGIRVGFRGHLQTRLNFVRTFIGNSSPCPLMGGTGRTLSFVFGPPSEQTLASESKFGTHGRSGSLRWLPPCYVLRYDPDVLSLCRADDSLVAVFSAGGATSETVMRAAKEDRQGLPAYFGPEEHTASVTRLVEARATACWEKFLRRERRKLETRKYGQLAKAILVRLPLEAQEEQEQMTSEDRKRAEEGLVALRSEQGELSSYKHIDDFTPEDCMNRIRAEMRRMEWLLERQTRRNALLRSTAF